MTVANSSLTGLLDRTVMSHTAVVTAISDGKWAVNNLLIAAQKECGN